MQFNAQPTDKSPAITPQSARAMSKSSSLRKIPLGKAALAAIAFVAVIALQIITITLLVNPSIFGFLFNNDTQAVISEVSALTDLGSTENIQVVVISDVKSLREQNDIQAEVYKDAENGDYVLGTSEKMVIYRRSEGKVIYDDKSPGQILQESQERIVSQIKEGAVKLGLVSEDSKEQVQATIVNDPDNFKKQNARFYSEVKQGDIIGVYNQSQVILIFRPETGEIINSGKFGINID